MKLLYPRTFLATLLSTLWVVFSPQHIGVRELTWLTVPIILAALAFDVHGRARK